MIRQNKSRIKCLPILLSLAFCQTAMAACDVKADFSFTVNNKTVTFFNTSQGSRNKYQWDFGDTRTSMVMSPIIYYNITNTTAFTVKLYAWDSTDQSCRDSSLQTITVSDDSCYANVQFLVAKGNAQFNKFILVYNIRSKLDKPGFKWLFGDGNISGEQLPEYTYAGPGQYKVCLIVIDQNCADTFCSMVDIDSTGTPAIKTMIVSLIPGFSERSTNAFSIFPNPGNGLFQVQEHTINIQDIEVYGSDGKRVSPQLVNNGMIDLSTYPPGLYLVQIRDSQGWIFTKKLLKY